MHTMAFVLAEVRMYIIVVGNGIWATRKTFDDTWGIVHCCRMADDACVPHMGSTQITYSTQSFGGDTVEGTATILLNATAVTTSLVVVGK